MSKKIFKPDDPRFKGTIFENYTTKDYPTYYEGAKLPDGFYPPIEDYTNDILTNLVVDAVYKEYLVLGADETYAKEMCLAVAADIIQALENTFAEYQIARNFHHPEESKRVIAIKETAVQYAIIAMDAGRGALVGCPIMRDISEERLAQVFERMFKAVDGHIRTLVDKLDQE